MRWMILLVLLGPPVQAETLLAARTIRAQALIGPEDLALSAARVPGALRDPAEALGLEARTTLFAGRPIRSADLGPPALVDRNQIVVLRYAAGPLAITTEGRALARGGAGDVIRVLNLSSRTTVSGRIQTDGIVSVGTNP